MNGVRSIAINSESVQNGGACGRGEVSIGSAAHLNFAEFEI